MKRDNVTVYLLFRRGYLARFVPRIRRVPFLARRLVVPVERRLKCLCRPRHVGKHSFCSITFEWRGVTWGGVFVYREMK